MTSFSSLSQEELLSALGALSVFYLSLKTAWGLAQILRIHVLSKVWKGVDLASYGPWAVVTGATSGIGKAYAHELARRGLNVVLISRSMEKLQKVAAEIEEQHGRSTKVIQTDFTHGTKIYEPIKAALEGLEIGILVNNVGCIISRPMYFLDAENIDQYIHDIVYCNIFSTVKMTAMILPQMVARKKGIVINLSSSSAERPLPLLTLYGSSKMLIDFFSETLDIEYRPHGIFVQSILPRFVDSNMTTSISKYLKMPADDYVRDALDTVGLTNRTNGCLSHTLQSIIQTAVTPDWYLFSEFSIKNTFILWEKVTKASK